MLIHSQLKIAIILLAIPLSIMATDRSLNVITQCTLESREGDVCTANIDPVCGFKPDVVCEPTTPCTYQTYSNSCEACHDSEVVSYTMGECPQITPQITQCSAEDRNADVCTADVTPVCGYMPDIVCVSSPCIYNTFTNPCEACKNPNVESYLEGACTPEQLEFVEIFNDQNKSGELIHLSIMMMSFIALFIALF